MNKHSRRLFYSKRFFLFILLCFPFIVLYMIWQYPVHFYKIVETISRNITSTDRSFNTIEIFPIDKKETTQHESDKMCSIPSNLQGPIEVDIEETTIEFVEESFRDRLVPGGWYRPKECIANYSVAIIVAVRGREKQVPIFLKNLHPFLMKQQIEYGIFIVEQTSAEYFNKGALCNVGFKEAMKLYKWDCFIFHDVDMIPMDDGNLYRCSTDSIRHLGVAVDKFGYKLLYDTLIGGVVALTPIQYKEVNGFSNSFWGWGGEDNDLYNRVTHFGYNITRYPNEITKYRSLDHDPSKLGDRDWKNNVESGKTKFDSVGLNSLKYDLRCLYRKALYLWILVEFQRDNEVD